MSETQISISLWSSSSSLAISSALMLVYEHPLDQPGGVDVWHGDTRCQMGVYWLDFLLVLLFLTIEPEEAS